MGCRQPVDRLAPTFCTVVGYAIRGELKENSMPRLLVRNLSISLDGDAAGPHQEVDNPLGVGGGRLHE